MASTAQTRASRRPRPQVRVLGWLAAAALVAVALLPGKTVQVASGATATQVPISEGNLNAEASPAPTATPEVTPTPTPPPTPTPDASPTPIDQATGYISVSPVLDKDGDPTTEGVDWLSLQGWEFEADFKDARVDVAQPVADELGEAWWFITYGDDTPIEITELVPDGYRLVDVQCGWAPDEETVERLPVERDGNSVAWRAVVGNSDYHDFWCTFVNVVEGEGTTTLPTLPPTDTAMGSAIVVSPSQADADPTPTPTPEPTPTPTPTPTPQSTPTPDPTPTPSPERETVAQISALALIDLDGDRTTLDDRHVFDGQWDFAGDFGAAEVRVDEPYSYWIESAFWLIAYTDDTPIMITALPLEGYTLLDVQCVASDNPNDWRVNGTSVFWVAPLTGRPVALDCEFIHAPSSFVPVRGSIEAIKVIDPDADPSTDNAAYSDRPFQFTLQVEGAELTSKMPTSVDGNSAYFGITYTAASAQVVITEIPQDGLDLASATCFDLRFEDLFVPVTVRGNSVSFEAIAPSGDVDGQYGCNIVNVRTASTATPRMTLPPTDMGGGTAPGGRVWPALLMLVIGAAACASAFGINRQSRRQGRRSVSQ